MYSVKQVAYIIKVHPLTVRRYIHEKKLAAVKVGGAVRVREDHLEAFQRAYETQEKHTKVSVRESYIFTELDPLWQLEGIGTGIGSLKRNKPL